MASGYRPRIVDAELRACLAASKVLLDEWQVEPALWNQVRRAVDAVDAPRAISAHRFGGTGR